jgi:hypothetical protein
MRVFLLVSLFAVLLGDIMLNLGLSLAPGLSLKNAMLYVIFVALVMEFLLGDRDPLRETWAVHGAWGLLVFYATFTWLAIVLLGLHREYDTVQSFIALKSQFADLFLFLLVYLYGPKDARESIRVLQWLIVLLVLVNVITLIDFLNIPDLGIITERDDGRITGPVQEVNQYGAILIFLIPVTAGLMLGSSGMFKSGSWVGIICGGLYTVYLVRDYVRRDAVIKGAVIALIIGTIAVVTVIVVNPEGVLKKFEFSADSSINSLSSGRIDVWRRLLTKMSYWPVSFLTGYGWNTYRVLIGIYGDPHNTYLLYWFNLGLIGLGLYLFVVLWVLRYTVSSLRYISEGLKPLVIGFIMGFMSLHVAIFFVALYTPWLFIWAMTGTVLRVIVDERRRAMTEAAQEEQRAQEALEQ